MTQSSNALVDIPKAPSLIHQIWIGGAIKPDYLEEAIKLAGAAKKSGFEHYIWVDNPENIYSTFKKLYPNIDAEPADALKALGIKLRHIDELKPKMNTDPFYNTKGDITSDEFWNYVDRERVGLKNLAAASDLIRYEILRQFGGIYVDTDTKFVLSPEQKLTADTLPLGIKCNAELLYELYKSGRLQFDGIRSFNNDIIECTPNHSVICDTIKASIKNLKQLDADKVQLHNDAKDYEVIPGFTTHMDFKRNPASPISAKMKFFDSKNSTQLPPNTIFIEEKENGKTVIHYSFMVKNIINNEIRRYHMKREPDETIISLLEERRKFIALMNNDKSTNPTIHKKQLSDNWSKLHNKLSELIVWHVNYAKEYFSLSEFSRLKLTTNATGPTPLKSALWSYIEACAPKDTETLSSASINEGGTLKLAGMVVREGGDLTWVSKKPTTMKSFTTDDHTLPTQPKPKKPS